jgi:hypothetical protein
MPNINVKKWNKIIGTMASQKTKAVHWYLQSVYGSDLGTEVTFVFNGHMKTQDNRYWSTKNPPLIYKVPLHYVKVGV